MVKIIGGGLAGCEASYQLLKRGVDVDLYEMRPDKMTPAHNTDNLAELVCSNSLKSFYEDTASGLLKKEMQEIGSLIISSAYDSILPAGSALAVDKKMFSQSIEKKLQSFDNFRLIREEFTNINVDENTIIASGPLTSDNLAKSIQEITGTDYLYFYDAVAPIISFDSIDMNTAFFASRYNKGDSDYINCPMTMEQYDKFYNELVNAKIIEIRDFDKRNVFESCIPVEIMAKRGYDSLRFGPLKPVGIYNPLTNDKYFAVVQLRKENKSGTIYNMVGFQTNLTFGEQKRVFSLIPALEKAEFLRYGVMHRNTYINSPRLLDENQRLKNTSVFFAGQITGVEGYVESAMSGMIAGINMSRKIQSKAQILPSDKTIIGALLRYISTPNDNFQPMNANFGILPSISERDKKLRKRKYVNRAIEAIGLYAKEVL